MPERLPADHNGESNIPPIVTRRARYGDKNISSGARRVFHILDTQELVAVMSANAKMDLPYLSGESKVVTGYIEGELRELGVNTLDTLIHFLEENMYTGAFAHSNRLQLSDVALNAIILELKHYRHLVHSAPERIARAPFKHQKNEAISSEYRNFFPTSRIPALLAVAPVSRNRPDGKKAKADRKPLDLARFALELGREDAQKILELREVESVRREQIMAEKKAWETPDLEERSSYERVRIRPIRVQRAPSETLLYREMIQELRIRPTA